MRASHSGSRRSCSPTSSRVSRTAHAGGHGGRGSGGTAVSRPPTGGLARAPARRAITEATAAAAKGAIASAGTTAALAALQRGDAGDQASALAIRSDFADQRVAGVRRLDARLGQSGRVEEHVLAVRAEHEAEALAGIVPLDLGLDRPVAALIFDIRRHFL